MNKVRLVTIVSAILSGKPFRHVSMINFPVPVWFKVHSDTEIHVLGPDDIVPWDDAIPLIWRTGECFEVQE